MRLAIFYVFLVYWAAVESRFRNFLLLREFPGIAVQCLKSAWIKKKTLHGLSPRANYTDRATAACQRSDCQLLRIEGATWLAWNPYGRILGFLDRSRYILFQVASQLYSRGWVDPVPDPVLFFLVVPGIEPGLRICSQELWPLDHRGGLLSST
jgi:hypothetical protein